MNARNLDFPLMLIPLLLLVGIIFPLLLYILPLLFYAAIVRFYAELRADVPGSNRNIRVVSGPRGPPRPLPCLDHA